MIHRYLFLFAFLLAGLMAQSVVPSAAAASKGSLSRSPAPHPDYARALAAADKFLQSWQAGDIENGTVQLSAHAKEKISSDDLENLFSISAPSAYEITRGRRLRAGRYEFPVVLFRRQPPGRRFSTIVVFNTGHSDWAVDKLP
jgi:hypothetical protein